MQDWAIMVIAIVAISTIGSIVNRALKARAGGVSTEVEARLARLEGLDERVRALEAIVTDPRHELAREIGALEGTPGRDDTRAVS